jgi:Protein of unknown function (DUF2875)
MKPRIWPYVVGFISLAIVWTLYVMSDHYRYWESTDQEMPNMGSSIRNGVLAVLGLLVAAYAATFAWMHRPASASAAEAPPQTRDASALLAQGFNGSPAMLSLSGESFILEVRGVGAYAGEFFNTEIWQRIEAKADNFASFLSQNPTDYPDNTTSRLDDLQLGSGMGFNGAARHAVQQWPVPVIVWEPPRDPKNQFRPATRIAGARQQAGLGVSIFLWQEDANTNDGAAMIDKLFTFFDTHPDVPAALVYSIDGTMLRSLLRAPGSGGPPQAGHIIPAMPDSVGALLVTRSDRVDKLIRPFAVEQTANVNKTNTEYDIIKLWNFYWAQDRVFQELKDKEDGEYVSALVPKADWWQTQLPELWKTLGNQGPGQFTPTPYIPVRWTTWQLRQFDNAPLLGYLHRPVDIRLTDDHGKPLKTALQAEAIKAGWIKAVSALPSGSEPKRVFYDTTDDRRWVIPLNQALSQTGHSAPNLDEVKEGYDIGARIGNTGVSSPLIQLGLGLIASYNEGGASATVNRRPNGMATIVMVSPPEPSIKEAWSKKNHGANPFRLR